MPAVCVADLAPASKFPRCGPRDYFCSGFRRWMLSALVNAIPFSRRDHIRQSLGRCRQLSGWSIQCVDSFSRGQRDRQRVSSACFAPVVGSLVCRHKHSPSFPARLKGALTAFPKGGTIPKPTHLRVVIGQPRRYRSMPRRPAIASSHCRGSAEARCGGPFYADEAIDIQILGRHRTFLPGLVARSTRNQSNPSVPSRARTLRPLAGNCRSTRFSRHCIFRLGPARSRPIPRRTGVPRPASPRWSKTASLSPSTCSPHITSNWKTPR